MAPIIGRSLNLVDEEILDGAMKLFLTSYNDEASFPVYGELISRLNNHPVTGIVRPGAGERRLTEEGDKYIKNLANQYIQKIDDLIKNEIDPQPDSPAKNLHKEMLRYYRRNLSNISRGISADQDPELDSLGGRAVTDYLPQMSNDVIDATKAEEISQALKKYPLDKYLKIGNDIQEMHEKLAFERDNLSEEEVDRRTREIRDKKRELLACAKELHQASQNPTKETLSLFGAPEHLTGVGGFLHRRGLDSMINRLEHEEKELQWREKGIPKEFGDYSVRLNNVVDIYGPHPKHHDQWEKDNVFSKTDFEASLKSYDSSKLPFTEHELAMIAMASSSLDTPENREARKKAPKSHFGLENNTFWTIDLLANEAGPRPSLFQYKSVIQNARENAQRIATDYANGKKTELAKTIQNQFRLLQKDEKTRSGLGSTPSAMAYGYQKSFMDMLDRDPELRKEFEAINQSVPEADKVDIDKLSAQVKISKMAVDKMNAEDALKESQGVIDQYIIDNLQKQVLRGDLMDAIGKNEINMMMKRPERVRKTARYKADAKKLERAGKFDELNLLSMRFNEETSKPVESLPYMTTENGQKMLQEFTDHMEKTYGPKMLTYKKDDKTSENFKTEIDKFTMEVLKNQNLERLSSGKELSPEEKKQIMADHIRYEFAANSFDQKLKTGEINKFHAIIGSTGGEKEEEHILLYDDKIRDYLDNLGLENMKPEEISEMLKLGAYREITDKIATSAELEYHTKVDKVPDFDDAVGALQEGKEAAWFGKSDYNKILDEMKALNEAYKANKEEFFKNGKSAIDPNLEEREQELLTQMDAYMARKEVEFEKNKERGKEDNAHSRMRYDAMVKAKNSLQKRMAYDKQIGDLQAVDAEYKEYTQTVAEKRSGELANQQVEPAAKQVKAATEATAENKFSKEAEALGVNEWEYNAARNIATAIIREKAGQEKAPEALEGKIQKSIGNIAQSAEFKKWAKQAQANPEKADQIGKMSPAEVRADFVNNMSKDISKDMNKQENKEMNKKLAHNKTVNHTKIKTTTEKERLTV